MGWEWWFWIYWRIIVLDIYYCSFYNVYGGFETSYFILFPSLFLFYFELNNDLLRKIFKKSIRKKKLLQWGLEFGLTNVYYKEVTPPIHENDFLKTKELYYW